MTTVLIAIAKKRNITLTTIWRNRLLFIRTKLRLLSELILSIASYSYERWVSKTRDDSKTLKRELFKQNGKETRNPT